MMIAPRRKVAWIVLFALLVALIAISARFRTISRRGDSVAETKKSAAAVPVPVVAKKPPPFDYPRHTGMRATPLAEGEKADPESPPHPLEAEIAAREARCKPWRETKVTISYTDLPLGEVLADLAKRYGLKFVVAPGLDLSALTVTFKVNELAADQALDLILKMADLHCTLMADGSLAILPKDADLALWNVKVSDDLRRLEETIDVENGLEVEASQDSQAESFWSSVKDHTLAAPIPSAKLYDSLDSLSQSLQMNVVISSEVRKQKLDDAVISDIPGGRSLSDTFDAWAGSAGLDWRVHNGLIYFGTKEQISSDKEKLSKRRAARKERGDALATLLARTVEIGGENLAIRDVADLLSQALDVPVRLDLVTWHRAARLSFDRAARHASDIVRAVQSAAPVRVELREGTIWFLGPKPPPGPQ